MKTPEQVKQELNRNGETVSGWARKNGFLPENVYAVLYGRSKGNWGESHNISVKLGLKDGEVTDQ